MVIYMTSESERVFCLMETKLLLLLHILADLFSVFVSELVCYSWRVLQQMLRGSSCPEYIGSGLQIGCVCVCVCVWVVTEDWRGSDGGAVTHPSAYRISSLRPPAHVQFSYREENCPNLSGTC